MIKNGFVRAASGSYFNLNCIESFEIESRHEKYYIFFNIPISSGSDEGYDSYILKDFPSFEEAQEYLDKMMQEKICHKYHLYRDTADVK